jgi:hypothetical protein
LDQKLILNGSNGAIKAKKFTVRDFKLMVKLENIFMKGSFPTTIKKQN